MTSVRLLTVELRFSDASPKDVARTLAPPEFESDLEDFFTECFVWAGTLVLGLPRDYGRESVDYIQSKYGLHVLSYREVAYPHSRAWDFDVERIC